MQEWYRRLTSNSCIYEEGENGVGVFFLLNLRSSAGGLGVLQALHSILPDPSWDHFGLHFPHLLQLFPQPLVLHSFLILLLSDVTVSWDCHTYHNCCLLLLVNHHHEWLVGQQLLICLELKVPQEPSCTFANPLWRCLTWGLGEF